MNAKGFLQAVLGEDGAKALAKAAERSPVLGAVLVPRTLVAWLSSAIRIGYEGEIPGVANSYITLNKSEEGFSGAVTVGEEVHAFEKADLLYVASAMGVALGIHGQKLDPSLRGVELSRLGKDIDLLVKAKLVAKSLVEGEAVRPVAIKVSPPVPTPQPEESRSELPEIKKSLRKEIRVSKSESMRKCAECGGRQFHQDKFVGCVCFRGLAKSVHSNLTIDGSYTVKFTGAEWDEDSLTALISVLKG